MVTRRDLVYGEKGLRAGPKRQEAFVFEPTTLVLMSVFILGVVIGAATEIEK